MVQSFLHEAAIHGLSRFILLNGILPLKNQISFPYYYL